MKISELKSLLAAAACKYVSAEEAAYFAEEVVEAHARKQPRSSVLSDAIGDIEYWKRAPGATWDIVKNLGGYTHYNGNHLGPLLKLKLIHDDLETKATKNGIAMMSLTNAKAFHTLHVWVQGLAKRGYFAMAAYNGGPDGVIPLNGTQGILGTNPIAFGFPGDKGDICIDMATSEIPYFHILKAQKTGEALPANGAVDSVGELTTDANKAIDAAGVSNLTPMGNTYKGYNLNYAVEVMTSALIGAKISAMQDPSYVSEDHGGFIIAFSIEKMGGRAQYDEALKIQNEEIRAQKPRAGVEKVIVPGDNNLERMLGVNADTEIEISEEVVAQLKSL